MDEQDTPITPTPEELLSMDIIVLGTLYAPPVEGEDAVVLPGWHVNTAAEIEGWGAYRTHPATPRNVFAGGSTYCYTFDSKAAFEAVLEQPIVKVPPQPPVPQSVTMRQARLALLAIGKLDTINAIIDTIEPPDTKAQVQIEWEYAQTVDRTSPWVLALQPALMLSDEDLDALFTAAAGM